MRRWGPAAVCNVGDAQLHLNYQRVGLRGVFDLLHDIIYYVFSFDRCDVGVASSQ